MLAFLDADVEIARDWLERVALASRSVPSSLSAARIVNGRPAAGATSTTCSIHSEWMARHAAPCGAFPTMAIAYRRAAVGDIRFPATNLGEDIFFALAVQRRGGASGTTRASASCTSTSASTASGSGVRQVAAGRAMYVIRRELDRPGRILVRAPILLFLYPHLWIVLARMLRPGMAWKALTLFPWLVAGETARNVGFLRRAPRGARRRGRASGACAMSGGALRLRQAASLVHDWVRPGHAIAQWTHFVTSACNAKCRHCFYPINQRQNELTLAEIERFLDSMPPIRLLLFSGGEPFLRTRPPGDHQGVPPPLRLLHRVDPHQRLVGRCASAR